VNAVSEVDGSSPNFQNPASNFSSLLTIRLESCVLVAVKICKIFLQFSIKNADTSEQKLNFLKNFNLLSQIELRATSDEKRLYFRIKSAGGSNYRGSVF